MCKRRLLGLIVPVHRYTYHKLRCTATQIIKGDGLQTVPGRLRSQDNQFSHPKFFQMEHPLSVEEEMKK